ncbi:hypothetical protein V2I59_05600 [Pseudomonas viridiflava]|uniref:RiboL-PSP-HEPN domain-containing protein n=1 Tax=Pseudomonas viridiflava TaxID=33069 RepID=A0ABU7N9E8_PSEVI|nr:hypothetical protein [Pseudomonas viridiflava]MEE4041560.1 hypothetical protein [Pseudomonas viridiflava]MEE4060653.1 hypothetical protein [Pseudomonas viridiflava]MEE4093006.1 hypothetical protein [Pseudomonas viridiflava]MEE4170155.1 hypothetical protein [Pseudomonas viridiflava]
MCGSSFESVLRNFSIRVGAEALEEFRSHLNRSIEKSKIALQDRYSSLVDDEFECPEDREHFEGALSDEAWQLLQIKYLGDSLAIVGLYRLAETQLTKAIIANHRSMDEKVRAAVMAGKTKFVKPRKLSGYSAMNELRLINNSVKHDDSKVTPQLARAYRSWKLGERMEDLDAHYDRLKPGVLIYVKEFISAIYSTGRDSAV